ncbi:MAG: FlgD immunoglobulin-like domain containing protein [Bacteroidota bacterium]|nr:hypothetical protein [Bacteroidota bacterium]MDW8138091.1 FlgD immunoglobulin-like domain containing protein [Bacteroidota bacterium]
MRRLLALCFGLWGAASAYGQAPSPTRGGGDSLLAGITRNAVTHLAVQGPVLWTSPKLAYTADGGRSWRLARADSLYNGRGTVYALHVEGDTIWASIGYSRRMELGGRVEFVPTAIGFVYSVDRGRSWTFRPPQLDAATDTVILYGRSRIRAVPVIAPEQSVVYDLHYRHGQLWVAGWASGIRRSRDMGRTWERIVLPPQELSAIRPDEPYAFVLDPRRDFNFLGFSVFVDRRGVVWAGTAGGLHRSEDGGRSWRAIRASRAPGALAGNWIIGIHEQPLGEQSRLWAITWPAQSEEHFALCVSADDGRTWRSLLWGERLYQVAFQGRRIWAAGANGLFYSDDGFSWQHIRQPALRSGGALRPDWIAYAVAVQDSLLWVGTSDGLLRSADGGRTWDLWRVEVPLRPMNPDPRMPEVETYAYPNPFAPRRDGWCRIRFALSRSGPVTVRIYDYALNLVATLRRAEPLPAGTHEVPWDGQDAKGRRLANGVYFYVVETPSGTFRGKILLLE